MTRQYIILNTDHAGVVGNLEWAGVKALYGDHPDCIRAICRNRKGRLQIKWVCSGLDATARENRDEIRRLNGIRFSQNLPELFTVVGR